MYSSARLIPGFYRAINVNIELRQNWSQSIPLKPKSSRNSFKIQIVVLEARRRLYRAQINPNTNKSVSKVLEIKSDGSGLEVASWTMSECEEVKRERKRYMGRITQRESEISCSIEHRGDVFAARGEVAPLLGGIGDPRGRSVDPRADCCFCFYSFLFLFFCLGNPARQRITGRLFLWCSFSSARVRPVPSRPRRSSSLASSAQ